MIYCVDCKKRKAIFNENFVLDNTNPIFCGVCIKDKDENTRDKLGICLDCHRMARYAEVGSTTPIYCGLCAYNRGRDKFTNVSNVMCSACDRRKAVCIDKKEKCFKYCVFCSRKLGKDVFLYMGGKRLCCCCEKVVGSFGHPGTVNKLFCAKCRELQKNPRDLINFYKKGKKEKEIYDFFQNYHFEIEKVQENPEFNFFEN